MADDDTPPEYYYKTEGPDEGLYRRDSPDDEWEPAEDATTAARQHTAMIAAGLSNVFTPATSLDLADQAHNACLYPADTLPMAKQAIRLVDDWADQEIWDDGTSAETALLGDALRDLDEKSEAGELETLGDVADWIGWWSTAYHAYVASGGAPEVQDELTLPDGSLSGALAAAERVIAEEHTTEGGTATDLRSITDDVAPEED